MAPKDLTNNGKYGDHSSSYWPDGWNYARYASLEDFSSISEDELVKIQAGFLDVLGEKGFDEWAEYKFAEEQEDAAEKADDKGTKEDGEKDGEEIATGGRVASKRAAPEPPEWLQTWEEYFKDTEWGFVIVQGACFTEDELSRWNEFKEELGRIVRLAFSRPDTEGIDSLSAAKDTFRLHWVEEAIPESKASDIATIRKAYQDATSSLADSILRETGLFLLATPDVASSILEAKNDEQARPSESSKFWREKAPYIFAVSASLPPDQDTEEEEDVATWKEIFKVAPETIIDELWSPLARGMTDLQKLTVRVKGVDLQVDNPKEGEENLDEVYWSRMPAPGRSNKRQRVMGQE